MSAPATGFAVHPAALPDAGLAALAVARLCHDLVSPLGAVGNGIELLELSQPDGAEPPPELALISDSVAAARARIATFRLAFGQASGDARVSPAEMERALHDFCASGRLQVSLAAPTDAARIDVKMILLALMCLETALPWGGRVVVSRVAAGWQLVAAAPRTRCDDGMWAWLSSAPAAEKTLPAPAHVQFPLLAAEAAAQRRSIVWDVTEAGAEIVF